MAMAAWFEGDGLPYLPPVEGLTVRVWSDAAAIARLNGVSEAEARRRLGAGNLVYVATLYGRPVAYGWVATSAASIGELGIEFTVPAGERYLWDFHTLPFCRGRGVYPRLLQAIVMREDAARFWIIHAPENMPSGVGIGRAGFSEVGELSFRANGLAGLAPAGSFERALAASDLLGVPLVAGGLSDCWACAGAGRVCRVDEPGGCACAQAPGRELVSA